MELKELEDLKILTNLNEDLNWLKKLTCKIKTGTHKKGSVKWTDLGLLFHWVVPRCENFDHAVHLRQRYTITKHGYILNFKWFRPIML